MKSQTAEIINLQSIVKKEDNFLSDMFFKKLKNIVEGYHFQWYFQNATVSDLQKEPQNNFMFTHNLFREGKKASDWSVTFEPIIYAINEKVKVKELVRMKLNLYTNQHKNIKHAPHQDFEDPENENPTIGLLNFTNCNGGTNIDKTVYNSKENEILIFDNKLKHFGITQTDTPIRIVLNIGWL